MAKAKTSKYKHVSLYKETSRNINKRWAIRIIRNDGSYIHKTFETEIEAAKAADLFLISIGKKPVNILKPKHSIPNV